jgi:hypothetical protein
MQCPLPVDPQLTPGLSQHPMTPNPPTSSTSMGRTDIPSSAGVGIGADNIDDMFQAETGMDGDDDDDDGELRSQDLDRTSCS